MKKLFLLFYILNLLNCVQARKSPFDPNNPFTLLSRVLSSASNTGSSSLTPSISYPNQTYSFYLNESVSIVAIISNVISCAVNPSLPTGLSLNTTDCNISGSAGAITASTSYTITATYDSNTTTVKIVLSVVPAYRIYMISTFLAGNLTTPDTTCNTNGNKPNSGPYKAILVSSTRRACSTSYCSTGVSENLDWVFKASTSYFRSNGTTLVGKTNESGIFANGNFTSLNSSISASSQPIWTGLNSDFTNSSSNCLNWTSNAGGNLGSYGISDSTLVGAFSQSTMACNNSLNLLCVEQ